ncbi:MAG TPA: glycosyltransferase family 10 [Ferruginibacter sp.]|nr:glycosyltransferase family 10 [Ferruginibacter sp.]
MINNKTIVIVNASFELGAALFAWFAKYAKHYDGQFAYWDEFAFTTDILPECDAILVFNNPSGKIQSLCPPENLLAFMMEPGIPAEHPWMFRGLEQYAAVYSPLSNSSNTIPSPGFLGWHVQQNWKALSELIVPAKQKTMSCIASGLKQLKGHRRRLDFIKELQKEIPAISHFGKGSNYIPDKMDGLLPYRFSIAIENTSAPYYFTEKLTDCFLAYTVPVYYGCTNIKNYFPKGSFIEIDIEEPASAIEKISEIIKNDDWQERLPAIKEARELVLNKYQPLAAAAAILRQIKPSPKQEMILEPVPGTLLRKIRNAVRKISTKK